MMTLNTLTEVLRRHGIGDPVSKISVDLKTPESTIRDWLKFAQQHSLTFKKIAGMTLKQFKEIRAQSSQPCARMLQPDWDYIVAESRKPLLTQRYKMTCCRRLMIEGTTALPSSLPINAP